MNQREIVAITKNISVVGARPTQPFAFRNYYQCPYDQTKWREDWSCTCNDRCPACEREIEPYFSEDVTAPYLTPAS